MATAEDRETGKGGESRSASIWRLVGKSQNSIVALNETTVGVPVYCVHPVSGDVVGLREFAALLHVQPIYGIQVPGRQMTAAFGGSIFGLARRYVDLIHDRQPRGPLVLAGWSAGAIIALEMAQLLCQEGREIRLLVALDGAPCNTGAGLSIWNPLYALKLLWNVPRWIRDDRRQGWSLEGIAARLESKLAFKFGVGVPALSNKGTIDAETMRDVVGSRGWSPRQKAFLHAMHKAMLDYRPRPYAGHVIVYETRTQPLYHLRQIGCAWKAIAQSVEIVSLKGNHSGLLAQPSVGRIADHLRLRLAEIDIRRKAC